MGSNTRKKTFFIGIFLLMAIHLSWAQTPDRSFDIVITNGHIIDGTGSPWYSGDVGIRDGKIAAIGNLSEAQRTRTIDAHGMVVAPGFIDMLGQSELTILVDPRLPSKIYQGITTEITGEGGSIAPLNDAIIQADRSGYDHYHITPDWRTFRQYFARLEKQGMGINLASYVGATQVRRMVLGDDDKQPTPAQLDQMRELVRQAMQEGAVGVSTSLEYAPAPYAKTEELIALASEASKFGGIYATHMRNESDAVLPAIDEALRIGREGHLPVEIWHLKVAGKANWGRMPEVVAKINAARAQGMDVTADTYAYTAWFNSFSAFIPPWAHDGGDAKLIERLKDPAMRARIRKDMMTPSSDWDNEWQEIPGPEAILIGVVQNPKLLPLQGKTLADSGEDAKQRSHGRAVRPPDRRQRIHRSRRLRHVRAGRSSRAAAALGFGRQRFFRHLAGRNSGPGASAPPRLRHLSAHPAQICPGRKEAHAGRCHPKILRSAGAAHAPDRPRSLESRDVGRHRGLRSRHGPRPGHLRKSQPVVAGNGVRAGERRSGD